jgi:hypothetical protein
VNDAPSGDIKFCLRANSRRVHLRCDAGLPSPFRKNPIERGSAVPPRASHLMVPDSSRTIEERQQMSKFQCGLHAEPTGRSRRMNYLYRRYA